MGRASLFDAFQAAGGATQTVLNSLDKEDRAQAAIEVQDAQLQNTEDFDRFLLGMQNSGDWENYEKNWESFKAKSYNAGFQNLSTPYARRIYESQYKEAEMKQRLTVRHAADQKRRLETVTNGYALVNRTIHSSSYIDKEVQSEDGSVYTKSAGEQKMEDVQKTLLNMYDGGLIDYAQLNQHMKEAAANVMLTDMVNAGKAAVDNMDNLETVLAKVGSYKGAYTTVAGDTVTQDMLMDKAKASVVGYFSEKQQLRWKESEQGASKIYSELIPALAKGDWEKATKIADSGIAYIKQQDILHKGDGFSSNTRDEYTQKFSIFDRVKTKDRYGGLSELSKDAAVDYLHYIMKNGFAGENENGKKETKYMNARELVDHFRDEIIPHMVQNDGANEAKILSHWGGALFKFADTLLKEPYAPAGVGEYIKDLDKNVDATMRARFGDKWAGSPEGKHEILYTQAYVKAQVASRASEFTIKDGQLNVDGIKQIVKEALSSVYTKELKSKPKDKDVLNVADAIASSRKEDIFGSNIETSKMKEQEGQLRNYTVKEVMKKENMSNDRVLSDYIFTQQSDGSMLVTDKHNNPVYMATKTTDKKGKQTYSLQYVKKDESGKAKLAQLEKTPAEVAKETEKFKKSVNSIYLYDSDETGAFREVAHSNRFNLYVKKIAPEDQMLFLEAANEIQANIKQDNAFNLHELKKSEDAIIELFERKLQKRNK